MQTKTPFFVWRKMYTASQWHDRFPISSHVLQFREMLPSFLVLYCIPIPKSSESDRQKRKTRIKPGTNRSVYRPKLISIPPFSSDVIDPFRLHSVATAMWRQRDDSKKSLASFLAHITTATLLLYLTSKG